MKHLINEFDLQLTAYSITLLVSTYVKITKSTVQDSSRPPKYSITLTHGATFVCSSRHQVTLSGAHL